MTTCNGCGSCCEVLGVQTPPETLNAPEASWRFDAPSEMVPVLLHELRFLRDNWTPISREQAIVINPMMANPHRASDSFYTCQAYDAETKRCTQYDERPRVCRSFPWGDAEPHPLALMTFPRCEFWRDLPRSLWPSYVDLPESVC